MRGVTVSSVNVMTALSISIHTPHARRDLADSGIIYAQSISIHTPHARRDALSVIQKNHQSQFQSTRLMRGVTKNGLTEDEI